MILPDVNVLIYAFRTDSRDHNRCRTWLDQIVNGSAAYGMAPQILASVVRICTHPRIFAKPDPLEDVLVYCGTLMAQPNATLVVPGERHWDIFQSLCRTGAAAGNLVADAWFAALAIESGCQWITTDRDFSRFPGLNWAPPF